MKKTYLVTLLTSLFVIALLHGIAMLNGSDERESRKVHVGFIYIGDESTPYTHNFMLAQQAMESNLGTAVTVEALSNVTEESADRYIRQLAENGCNIIFTTSYGFSEPAKEIAKEYPDIQFCQATGDNANKEPFVSNYHTFMGRIYEGRYLSGVVAGMKLDEMIKAGKITKEQAQVGYVGAYPNAEVISGYTAFLLGIKSVVPEAKMHVEYTNTWTSYTLEKSAAQSLIDKGCVIISQHSDTIGPAVACEQSETEVGVFHVGYNQSMIDVAPTTSLVSAKINWEPYITKAVTAVLEDKTIEDVVKGNVRGNDIGAGVEQNWIEMLEFNDTIIAKGTKDAVERDIKKFKKKLIAVFKGNYTGVNPDDVNDTIDLRNGYQENQNSSAPTFHYVLQDEIFIE